MRPANPAQSRRNALSDGRASFDIRERAKIRTGLPWLVSGLLLLAIAIIYGQTLGFGFLEYDDNLFVHSCPQVRAGLTRSSIAWAFTNGPLGEWYPLSMLSHMLDCQLFGLDAYGHHLTNVLLHAATAVGLFLFWRSMTGESWPSAFVAALFAIHPQHVESVAWVAERRDVLSGFFFVLTLAAYLGYVRHGRTPGRYLLVAFVFSLGLMSKAMLVTVPPLLLLLDFWPLGRLGRAADLPATSTPLPRQNVGWLVAEKLPLLAIALADCYLTVATHARNQPIAWPDRLAGAAVAAVTYLCQFFYPTNLAVFYPFPTGGYPAWKVAGSVALLAAVSAAVTLDRRRRPYFFVGWFWFLGMLVPVLGLVQVSDHAMADRYMYLPSIGLSVALAFGAERLGANSPARRWVLGAGAAVTIVLLVGLSTWQTSYWRDGEKLWKHAIAVSGDTTEAEIGLAETMRYSGRLDEAIGYFRRLAPTTSDPILLNNFGTVLIAKGELDEAAAQLRRALVLDPDSALINDNLGGALAQQHKFQEAIFYFRRATECDPKLPAPHVNLARVLFNLDQIDDAIDECHRALDLEPENEDARQGLKLLEEAKTKAKR